MALVALCGARANAQPAPYHHWRTLDTPHFHVHADARHEREGRVAAAAAERAYALLARELVEPRGPIDLVVSDDADYANGSATPFPNNRIVVLTTPPIENGGLDLADDWIALVVTHELTHVFHLDRTRGIWNVAQHVFGRAPYLFPNSYSPSWLTEGLAVYYESRLTTGGRLRSDEHRSIARAAAQEDRLPNLGDVSLGSPRFPGGAGAYVYGSLFMEYLAATHGDSTIPRFVERQSAALIPIFQDRAAHRVFGTGLSSAFGEWRDSVQRTAGERRPPLADWRELTTHAWYAMSPRWVNDTTIVYAGSDGRTTTHAYLLTTSGVRTTLGRRSSAGANVPMRDGSLLFAQPEYVDREVVRSDLWIERDGVQQRLTRNARLLQPDVNQHGTIVAVQLAAARASLVLVDASGGIRMLRDAASDETWSEPRWSASGESIVAVHRFHGGAYAIELLDAAGRNRPLVRRNAILSSPSFTRNGSAVMFVSEESGTPQVYRNGLTQNDGTTLISTTSTALGTPEESPDGRTIAAVQLRADGYHIGIGRAVGAPYMEQGITSLVHPDSQALAAGTYREYSAASGLKPRYWLPVIESGVSGRTRLGATTSGNDPVGRHAYAAYLALETGGRFATGGLGYRYAGFRPLLVDANTSQDWSSLGNVVDSSNARLGIVARRIQDASLAATWVRPRYRTYSALTAGLGVERRRFATDPEPLLTRLDPAYQRDYTYPRAYVGASWSNAQQPLLAISREDGIALGVTARERLRTDDASGTISTSVVGTVFGYKSLDLPGFAHHVLALRLAGGVADARTSTAFEVGGTSGGTLEIGPGVTVGEGRRTFGVRGFPTATIFGTSAAAASIEFRAPLLLRGRGTWAIPVFFNRSSFTAFADAGTASCAASPRVLGICSSSPVIGRTIASVGGELGVSVAILQVDMPELLRVGVAVPVAGRALVNDNMGNVSAALVYLALGYSF